MRAARLLVVAALGLAAVTEHGLLRTRTPA